MTGENGARYVDPALRDLPESTIRRTATALRRLADPEEIAAAVAILVSGDASYVTGTTPQVDGGQM